MWLQCFFLSFFCTLCFGLILPMRRKRKQKCTINCSFLVFSFEFVRLIFIVGSCVINLLVENMVNGQTFVHFRFKIIYMHLKFEIFSCIELWHSQWIWMQLVCRWKSNQNKKKAKPKISFRIGQWLCVRNYLTLLRLFSMTSKASKTVWFRKSLPHLLSVNFIESLDLVGL